MGQVMLQVGADYPLTGVITNFEAYMFSTTERHFKEHVQPMQGEIVLVNGNKGVTVTPMADRGDRSRCLKLFNMVAKAKIPSMPKPDGLSCCMIDFTGDDACTDVDYDGMYCQLKMFFLNFMRKNDKVAVMVQHWAQDSRWPHVHILYERGRGAHNEFQTWLCQQWGVACEF